MIVYRKAFLGLHLLLRLYGSAMMRTALWGCLAALQTTLLYCFMENSLNRYFTDTGRVVSYTIFSTMLALLVIFRQNAGYGRYHEGRVRVQSMSAAWVGSAIKALDFDGGRRLGGVPPGGAAATAATTFRLDVVHLFSLLHAVAVQFLRSDWALDNLGVHDSTKLPPWDSGASPSYSPRWIDYLVLRASSARRTPFNAAHPIPVIGGLSPAESAALYFQGQRERTMTDAEWDDATAKQFARAPTIMVKRARKHMFTHGQAKYVRGAAERLYQVFYWIHELLRQRMAEGGLQMPAPILATLYTSLQAGLDSFEHARYLCDTPFPFAWAQMIVVMLLTFQFTLPFVIVSSMQDQALGTVMAVFVVQAYWSLNEVSRELEDPFSFEPNDIPLARLQFQFNERLLAAANTRLPSATPDPQDAAFRAAIRDVVARAAAGSLAAPDQFTRNASHAVFDIDSPV